MCISKIKEESAAYPCCYLRVSRGMHVSAQQRGKQQIVKKEGSEASLPDLELSTAVRRPSTSVIPPVTRWHGISSELSTEAWPHQIMNCPAMNAGERLLPEKCPWPSYSRSWL